MLKDFKSITLFPLVMIFARTLKGKKQEYTGFISDDRNELKNKQILEVESINNSFSQNIKSFFDKESPIYDKTLVKFKIDLNVAPELRRGLIQDFLKTIDIYYAMSMLGAKIPNENIYIELDISNQKVNTSNINNLLRYILLAYGSRKVDRVYLSGSFDTRSQKAYETLLSYLNSSKIENYSNSKSLHVITCKNSKQTLDIVWSSGDDIELTNFNTVFNRFGEKITKDIKVSQNPIYALHKWYI